MGKMRISIFRLGFTSTSMYALDILTTITTTPIEGNVKHIVHKASHSLTVLGSIKTSSIFLGVEYTVLGVLELSGIMRG